MLDSPRLIALLLALLCASDAPELVLPAGPAARAWSTAEPGTAPRELPPSCSAAAHPAHWDTEGAWERWAEALVALRAGRALAPAESAELALSALSQGRGEDAWQHFAALGGQPGWQEALIPYLVLGGPTLQLAEGALLAPALPPLDRNPAERALGLGRLEKRELWLRGLQLGAARVNLRVSVEYDGVQIDLEHIGGGDARVRVVVPEPLDFELSSVYVDWEREPQASGEHEVLVSPEVPTMTIYGRCRPVQRRWPLAVPTELDARVQRHGFDVVVAKPDVATRRATGFARALAKLTGVPARVVAADAPSDPAIAPGIALDFAHGPERVRKFRCVLSAMEHFAGAR